MKPIPAFLIVLSLIALPISLVQAQPTNPPAGSPPAAQPPAPSSPPPSSSAPSSNVQPGAAQPASAQSQLLVGSDSLVGSTVRNSEGRDVGKVSRLMIDPNDGRVASVVVAMGGTLGVGSNTIAVPWNSVKLAQDRGKVIVTTNVALESVPTAPSNSNTGQSQKQ